MFSILSKPGSKASAMNQQTCLMFFETTQQIKYEISTILNFEKEGEQKVIDVVIFDGCGTWDLTTDVKLTAKIKIN